MSNSILPTVRSRHWRTCTSITIAGNFIPGDPSVACSSFSEAFANRLFSLRCPAVVNATTEVQKPLVIRKCGGVLTFYVQYKRPAE